MNKYFKKESFEETLERETKYFTIPLVGIRLIFRNGKYDGWYHYKLNKVV